MKSNLYNFISSVQKLVFKDKQDENYCNNYEMVKLTKNWMIVQRVMKMMN